MGHGEWWMGTCEQDSVGYRRESHIKPYYFYTKKKYIFIMWGEKAL